MEGGGLRGRHFDASIGKLGRFWIEKLKEENARVAIKAEVCKGFRRLEPY